MESEIKVNIMNYCVTLLLETFDQVKLNPPESVVTAWGEAVRAENVGQYSWKRVIVTIDSPVKHITRLIPPIWTHVKWHYISISNFKWQDDVLTDPVVDDVMEFISLALHGSEKWCVCIEKNCDQIDRVLQSDLNHVLSVFLKLLSEKGSVVDGMFCFNE